MQADQTTRRAVQTVPRPACPICESPGAVVYEGLTDRIFGAEGVWSVRRCPSARCGLLWLDPMPAEAELPGLYQDYYTHGPSAPVSPARERVEGRFRRATLQARLGYAQALSPWLARILARLAAAFPSGADGFLSEAMFLEAPRGAHGRLLEIGCGSGEALARMRELGWSCLGTDFDQEAVATARRLGLDVRLGGVEQVHEPDGSFDAIYMGHVIEHVVDAPGLIGRCRDLLAPGGALVLVTPNVASVGLRWFGPSWRGLEPPRHLQLFTPAALARLCEAAGLQAVQVRTSAKGARYILGSSLRAARSSGSAGPLAPPGGGDRVAALALQLVERALLLVRPSGGEELVLVARRRG